jgi:CRP-like cAMP-binding protein
VSRVGIGRDIIANQTVKVHDNERNYMQIEMKTLKAQPFFKDLPEPLLTLLVNEAMPAEFKAGEPIFYEGEPANRFYLICSGQVQLESPTDAEHEPVAVETLGAGSMLGWSWLFPPYRWHFDASAITPVKAIFFYGTRLREECETNHELGYHLMKRVNEVVVERLQSTRRHLIEQRNKLLTAI